MSRLQNFLVALALCALSTLGHAASATRSSSFAYEQWSGLITKEIIEPGNSALCAVTTYGYDAYGNKTLTETRNCNGSAGEAAAPAVGSDPVIDWREAYGSFDAQGRFMTSSTNPVYLTETREYDTRFGATTKLTGPNGLVTTWTYDSFGRKTLETRADTTRTQFDYLYCTSVPGGTVSCPANAVYVVVTTPLDGNGVVNGAVSKSYFDALNREIRSETQGFAASTLVYKDTQYDANGRVSRVSRPYYSNETPLWTTRTYDAISRVLTETVAGVATTHSYAARAGGGVTITTTVNGPAMPGGVAQTKTTAKNTQGQTLSVTDTQGNIVSYTYDPFGNVLSTNAAGVVTTMAYDLRGRKASMVDPDMGTWTYAYDVLGQLKRQTNPKAQVSTMRYDAIGRMVARDEPDLKSTWGFDWCTMGKGKLCDVGSDNGYRRNLAYDSLGRMRELMATIDTYYVVSYAYDANGRLSETTYPENTVWPADIKVRNVYNARGYLEKVTDDAATPLVYWQANTVSATGKVLTETLGNGATTTRSYDTLDRMTGNVVAKSGVNLQSFTYAYDSIGNVTSRINGVQSNLTENFAYDTLNRLTQSSGAGLTTTSYNYNALGNITYKSDVGTYNYPAVGAARPHAVSSITGTVNGFGNPGFTYDANGNLTAGLGRTLTYTSFDMPLKVTGVRLNGGTSYTYDYTYNAEHERTRLIHSTLGMAGDNYPERSTTTILTG